MFKLIIKLKGRVRYSQQTYETKALAEAALKEKRKDGAVDIIQFFNRKQSCQ